jgi:hypothetical protein
LPGVIVVRCEISQVALTDTFTVVRRHLMQSGDTQGSFVSVFYRLSRLFTTSFKMKSLYYSCIVALRFILPRLIFLS